MYAKERERFLRGQPPAAASRSEPQDANGPNIVSPPTESTAHEVEDAIEDPQEVLVCVVSCSMCSGRTMLICFAVRLRGGFTRWQQVR